MVIVWPEHGLCNRLHVVTSFAMLAERHGHAFGLCWTPSHGFSKHDLTQLFEGDFERVSPREFAEREVGACRVHELPEPDPRAMNGLAPLPAAALGRVRDARDIAYRGDQNLAYLTTQRVLDRVWPGYWDEFARRLRQLRPVAPLRARIEQLVGRFGPRTVGVHVRRGDALHPIFQGAYAQSTDEAFFRRMDRELATHADTTFYLATDDQAVQRVFRERYGSRLMVQPNKRFEPSVIDRPKHRQRDAVVDLYALSRTRALLATANSTFSITAALLGGIPRRTCVERRRAKPA